MDVCLVVGARRAIDVYFGSGFSLMGPGFVGEMPRLLHIRFRLSVFPRGRVLLLETVKCAYEFRLEVLDERLLESIYRQPLGIFCLQQLILFLLNYVERVGHCGVSLFGSTSLLSVVLLEFGEFQYGFLCLQFPVGQLLHDGLPSPGPFVIQCVQGVLQVARARISYSLVDIVSVMPCV